MNKKQSSSSILQKTQSWIKASRSIKTIEREKGRNLVLCIRWIARADQATESQGEEWIEKGEGPK